MRKAYSALFALSLTGFITAGSVPAQALTDAERAAIETERLNREQQIRQREQQIQDERAASRPTKIEVPLPTAPDDKSPNCRDIKNIDLKGATLMSESKQEEIVEPFEGKCLGVNEIQKLLAEITGYYIKKGYAASRAYIPEQDLSTGNLEILIVEGTVSGVKLEDGGQNSINIGGAFPGVVGDPLNLRDFEQGLDQVNRLFSNKATLDIQPGEKAGDSVVVIKNEPSFPLGLNLTADSYGSRGTGRYQLGSTVTANNLLGVNEMFSYTRRQSAPNDEFNQNSQSNSVFFSVPYGYATLSGGYSDSAYESQIITPASTVLELDGDSANYYGKLDYNLIRTQTDKVNVAAMLTSKETNSYAAGQRLAVSSRTLTVLDLDALYSTPALGGFADLGVGMAFGTRMFGALKDEDGLPGVAPKAQFKKLKLSANYNLPFEVLGENMNFGSQFVGQYSFDTLFGSEQISIGGPYSVRGFYVNTLANDHGYYIRNDLSLREALGDAYGVDWYWKPYIAIDAGTVSGRVPKTPNGSLVGGAVGFSFNGGSFMSFDIFTSRGFVHPEELEDEGGSTFARLSFNF